jgi:hypothetical protein
VENLRRRASGRLDKHDWVRPSLPAEQPPPPPEEDEAAKLAAKQASKAEEKRWAGMNLPPIRLGTRELLLRPPEPDWSVAGFTIAVFNILFAPAAATRNCARDSPRKTGDPTRALRARSFPAEPPGVQSFASPTSPIPTGTLPFFPVSFPPSGFFETLVIRSPPPSDSFLPSFAPPQHLRVELYRPDPRPGPHLCRTLPLRPGLEMGEGLGTRG